MQKLSRWGVLITALAFSSLSSASNTADTNHSERISANSTLLESSQITPCSNPKKLKGLCMAVAERGEDPNPRGRYHWLYQRKLMDAACVDISQDSEQVIAQKIAYMWKVNEESLTCENTQFDVTNGSLIKFAVAMKFDEFLISAAEWKINFNKIDRSDGKTVLDYIQEHMELNKGSSIENRLHRYYVMLRKAGAKHRHEL